MNGIDVANILFAFFGLAVLTLIVVTGESGTDVIGVPDDTWF